MSSASFWLRVPQRELASYSSRMGSTTSARRERALEKLLLLEQAAADEVDTALVSMVGELRRLARENVTMRSAIFDTLHFCHAAGVDLGDMAERLEDAARTEG